MAGTLYGVGVGPGDPDLMTLKAVATLARVPVIAYPQLGDTPSFARSIAAKHLSQNQREIVVRVPLGDEAKTREAYDKAASDMASELDGGHDVAALCEGDPFLYGSFIYLWDRLRDRFACEIIPGVSSLMAAPARGQAVLATGQSALAVVPGTLPDEALEPHLTHADSIAILKVGRHLPRLTQLIDRLGLMDHAHYVERATLDSERVMPLRDLADDTAPYFSIILIARHREAGR